MKKSRIIVFSIAVAMLLVGYVEGMDERWDLPPGCSWRKEGKFFEIKNPSFYGDKSIIEFLKGSKQPLFGVKLDNSKINSEFFNTLLEMSDRLKSLSFISCRLLWDSANYRNVKNLKRLEVEGGCMPKEVLNAFIENNVELTSLRLIDVCKDLGLSCSNLKNLKELFLVGMHLLSEETFVSILKNNKDLEYVYLCNCEKISFGRARRLSKKYKCVIEWYKVKKEVKKEVKKGGCCTIF